jgi:hypothetical protein
MTARHLRNVRQDAPSGLQVRRLALVAHITQN